jgi:hypothetical protein
MIFKRTEQTKQGLIYQNDDGNSSHITASTRRNRLVDGWNSITGDSLSLGSEKNHKEPQSR